MERNYIKLVDSDGKRIYDEFAIDSLETVRVTLTRKIDGTSAVYDVSSSSIKVYFRMSVKGSSTISLNVELTDVTDGTDGKVSGDVKPTRAAFSGAPQDVECGVFIVNESVADANTPSTYQETLWKGRWLAYLREAMHE